MKFWSSEHTFDHVWEVLTTAFWQKYPTPLNPAVRSVDVIDRTVSPNGELISDRVLGTSFNLPEWITKLIGTDRVLVSERSVVNPETKTMTMHSKNLTFNSILTIEETIVYTQDKNDPTKTHMTQEARVTIPRFGLSYLEAQVADTIAGQAHKGRQAMENIIHKIEAEIRDLTAPAAAPTMNMTQ